MLAQGEANRSAAPFRVTLGCMPKRTMNPNGVALSKGIESFTPKSLAKVLVHIIDGTLRLSTYLLKVRATPLGFLVLTFTWNPGLREFSLTLEIAPPRADIGSLLSGLFESTPLYGR